MALITLSAPAVEPVSEPEVKSHLRLPLDDSSEDELLRLLIQVARETAEVETGRALITRELLLTAPASPCVDIPLPPLIGIDEVKSYSSDGVATLLTAADYRLDKTGLLPRLRLPVLCADDVLTVRYRAGYGTGPGSVPAAIRRWMLMHVGTLYEHREAVVVGPGVNALPRTFVDGLLDPFRVPRM